MKSAPVRARSLAGIQYVRVQHHPGEEARFRDPEQRTSGHERRDIRDEHGRHRHDPPSDEDSRNPSARPDPLENQIARYLEQAVGKKEEACAEAGTVLD